MPLKLYPPRLPKHPNWRIRGTYLGKRVDRSSGTSEKKTAARILAKLKSDIERGAYAAPGAKTFAGAAAAYMKAGGENRFMEPILKHFGERPLADIDQAAIDEAAEKLYPEASQQTRNRQVYSPISAVLKRAGVEAKLKRPKGWRGEPRVHWLRPEQLFALFDGAEAAAGARFRAFLIYLTYTGSRLSEACRLTADDVHLQEAFAYSGKTKNGQPRPVHLPPIVVSALANLDMKTGKKVFGLTKCGRLYSMLAEAEKLSGVTIPAGIAFHVFRHSYGALMRRVAGLDTSGLVGTGAWKSRESAAVYEHVDVSEAAQKSDLLPTPPLNSARTNLPDSSRPSCPSSDYVLPNLAELRKSRKAQNE